MNDYKPTYRAIPYPDGTMAKLIHIPNLANQPALTLDEKLFIALQERIEQLEFENGQLKLLTK
jgi:hypothetical protein